jgi:hypothetical protein
MPAIPERFGERGATHAFLRGAWRIDPDANPASFRRFAEQDQERSSPRGIVDRHGEPASSQPFDVEVFDGNQAVPVHNLSCDLVMKIPALVADMRVYPLQRLYGISGADDCPSSGGRRGVERVSISPERS